MGQRHKPQVASLNVEREVLDVDVAEGAEDGGREECHLPPVAHDRVRPQLPVPAVRRHAASGGHFRVH